MRFGAGVLDLGFGACHRGAVAHGGRDDGGIGRVGDRQGDVNRWAVVALYRREQVGG